MPFCGIGRCDWLYYCRFCSFSHVLSAVFWPLFGAKVGIINPTNKIFYHFFRIFLWFFRPKLFCFAEKQTQNTENVAFTPSATFRQPDCHFLAVSRKGDEDERVREGGAAKAAKAANAAKAAKAAEVGAGWRSRKRRARPHGEGAPGAPSRRQGHKKRAAPQRNCSVVARRR